MRDRNLVSLLSQLHFQKHINGYLIHLEHDSVGRYDVSESCQRIIEAVHKETHTLCPCIPFYMMLWDSCSVPNYTPVDTSVVSGAAAHIPRHTNTSVFI